MRTSPSAHPPLDVTGIALHVAALVVWPIALAYATFKLLAARWPVRRTP